MPFFDGASRVDSLTPSAIRQSFMQAENGYPGAQIEVIRRLIEADAHARSLFEKRDAAVASKPSTFLPGDSSTNAANGARIFELACRKLSLRKALGHLLLGTRYGFSAVEIEWGTLIDGGRPWVVPVDLILPLPDRFRIGVAGMTSKTGAQVRLDELRIFTDPARPFGDELEPAKWIVHRYGTEQLARAGLGRTAAALLMGKRFGFRDWLILSERFGIPMPIAKYKEHASDGAKETARLIIQNLGSDGGAVISDDIELDIKSGVDVDKAMQGALIEFVDRQISKLVNGSTDATDSTEGGSYARASIHGDVRFETVSDDASALHDAIDTMLAKPFAAFNGVSAPPRLRQQIARDLSPKMILELADTATNKLGMGVSQQYLYANTGLQPPVNDADKAPGAPKPEPPTAAKPDAKSEKEAA